MNLKMVYTINAVLGVLFGLAFLLMPDTLLDFYGISLGEAGISLGRLLGAAYCGLGLISWLMRDHTGSPAGTAVTTGLFGGSLLALIVSLISQLGGVANALGWSTVVIFLVLTAGFGYYRFMNQS